MRQGFNQSISRWSPARGVRENLEAVMGIAFPSPTNTTKEDFSEECSICYSYRLQQPDGGGDAGTSAIPDVVCENKCCGRPFHQQCLFEWLQALTTSRTSFETIFGTCPYCSAAIQCKRPR